MFDTVLTVVYLLIGVYCAYSGIAKKGRFFNNNRVEETRVEEFTLYMSRMLSISGILLIIGAGLELLKFSLWISIGCYVMVIIVVAFMVAKMRKCLKKEQ